MSSRKRQRRRRSSPDYTTGGDLPRRSSPRPPISELLYHQAHEATIIRNRPDLAKALKAHDGSGGRSALIKWHGETFEKDREVWLDRYDARLLLDSLPTHRRHEGVPPQVPPSPTGWSDLPSDSEETFFHQPHEIEERRHEKRRKLFDFAREERLRALKDSDPDPVRDCEEDKEKWGDDSEEPEDAIKTLMERTATHLVASPNPGQLEMRILTNHGADDRFAFLRGRWKDSWQKIKANAESEKAETERRTKELSRPKVSSNTSSGLVAYGSDSDDSN